MSTLKRPYGIAVAQLGPIHLADSRASVVKRLIELLREAKSRGAKFVVFPELALTTFFPRYWMSEEDAIERFFERSMRGPKPSRCSISLPNTASASISAMPS